MTRHTLLLFATPEILLGELALNNGAYGHLTLTEAGEKRLETFVADWQTQEKNPEFQTQFQNWCATQHIAVVLLKSPVQVDYWHTLLRLPLAPGHRFTMVSDIAQANADGLVAWQEFLARANHMVTIATKKAQTTI